MAARAADDDLARLIQVLSAVEADAVFRCLVSRSKCHELQLVLAYVGRARQARALAHEAAQKRHAAAQAEARSLESSLSDAIRRARRIRLQLGDAPSDDSDGDDDDEGKAGDELAGILAQARAIRATDRVKAEEPPPTAAGEDPGGERQASPLPTRVEYPRRMKALLETLADYEADERASSFRAAFCRKMTEHLSMRESVKELRIQVGYAHQVERLGLAYRRLGEYLEVKGDMSSDAVQRALQAPSLSTVFPVFCRLKMARAQLSQLDEITSRLARRLPARPALSQSAISHRDAMLERFRKKARTAREAVATTSNRLLLAGPSGSRLAAHESLLEKLQLAWEHDMLRAPHPPRSLYANAVDETILSELSNLVLSAFQRAFCDGVDEPSQSAMRELMSVIRVAESAVVHKARRQRSVVQR